MYFEKPGKQNTQETVNIALQAAKELGIDTIVVATNTGDTADLLKDAARSGLHVVAVSHCFGFKDPEVQEMPAERKSRLGGRGHPGLHCHPRPQRGGAGAVRQIRRDFPHRGDGLFPADAGPRAPKWRWSVR